MFKVLIVDDEPFIRLGLRKMIQWEELGFIIVDEARNGEEALAKLGLEPVDLIITDISMPKKDGISFISEVRKIDKYTNVIFLTGYKEFEYAKQGIRLGVQDYLLKPINPKELEKVLNETKIVLEQKIKTDRILDEINNNSIVEIIQGKRQDSDLINKVFTASYVNVCKIEVVDFDTIAEEWMNSSEYYFKVKYMKDLIDNVLKDKKMLVEGELGNYYLIFNSENGEFIDNNWEELLKTIFDKNNIKVSILVGQWVEREKIKLSYFSLRRQLSYKEIITEKKAIEGSKVFSGFSKQMESLLIEYVTQGDYKVFDLIEEIEKQVNSSNTDIFIISFILHQVIEKIIEKIKNEYGYVHKLFEIKDYEYSKDDNFENKDLLLQDFKATIEKLLNLFGNFKVEYKDAVIRQACQYVVKNIDENISLSNVADELKISKNYFCTLFKNETGENFLSFVTRAKMERAKYLLKNDNMKVYEVCDYLGYNDTTYFTRVFKKYVSMTPYEYKKIGG